MPKGKLNPADKGLDDQELIRLFSDPKQIPERYSMALMFDEGVNQKAIAPLLNRCERLNITTVQIEELSGEASDWQLLAYARRIACTLVVEDQIYAQFHRKLDALGIGHAGIIWVRDSDELLDALIEFVAQMYQHSIDKDAPNLLHHEIWQV